MIKVCRHHDTECHWPECTESCAIDRKLGLVSPTQPASADDVEAVARAMHEAEAFILHYGFSYDDRLEDEKRVMRGMARAAIAAYEARRK